MGALDGFEVAQIPANARHRSKYAAIMDAALACGEGECLARSFESLTAAKRYVDNFRAALPRLKHSEPSYRCLHVGRRDKTVYIYSDGGAR